MQKSREGAVGVGGRGGGERRISYCKNAKKARRAVRVDVKRRLEIIVTMQKKKTKIGGGGGSGFGGEGQGGCERRIEVI